MTHVAGHLLPEKGCSRQVGSPAPRFYGSPTSCSRRQGPVESPNRRGAEEQKVLTGCYCHRNESCHVCRSLACLTSAQVGLPSFTAYAADFMWERRRETHGLRCCRDRGRV